MKKRESNLELMRVVLMCITPAYHLLVYNLILKAAWNDAMGVTLAFTVAGAIPANYAFMAMSSYFLLEERGGTSLRRFLNTAALTATLYLVRFAVIRGLYGFDSKEYMVEGFITKGAWWYMDSYLILLLLYPFLNRFLRGIGRRAHLALAKLEQEGKLKADGAVEVVEEVAPAFKDGGFILVLRKLVVNILVLDRLGVKGIGDTADTVREYPLIRDAVLRRKLLFIGLVRPGDGGLDQFSLGAGQFSLFR